ncbi:ALBINO3-like protein 1, chloroplastic [Camellia sinensis]|uniref:ALBINO3-like protein 1, chloroplastic n=1 Tax=Camellia sinensis TaxID=4442 RepID=UPI0010367C18|nr:ALBINO3-like protein 1, chloroplastic [Camellia sinensis]
MAQQVFLQKSGVTKNPVSKFSDNIIKKEEQSQIQKSVFETSTIIKEPQVEKSTSEGLCPGERFKQLKEQEARRRQQREEEKKKAEEAAANVTQTNGAHEKEAISVQGKSGDEVESSDSKNGSPNSLTGMTNSSSTDYRVVNGNLSNLDSKEDQRTSGLLLNRVVVSNFYSLCFICIMLPYFLVGFTSMVIT